MKEKIDSDDEENDYIVNNNKKLDKNALIINNRLSLSSDSLNEKEEKEEKEEKIEKIEKIEKNYNEEERLSLSDEYEVNGDNPQNKKDIKMGSKILCPSKKCYSNAIINVNPYFFEINSNCGEHKNKMDIIEFVNNSGGKEDKETCNFCNKTYKSLIENKNILYKCSCGINICDICKETSLKNHPKEHNMIDFKEKDCICCCNNKKKKFLSFCLNCKKNLCIICNENHKTHETINLRVIKIDEKILKEKLKEQKNKINKFNIIIDKWLKRVNEKIEEFKKKLQLHVQLNEIIINQYSSSKKFYQSFKNNQYINFDLDEFVLNILKFEHSINTQNEIIVKFLKKKMEKDIDLNKYKESELQNIVQKYSHKIDGIVYHICELKQKEFLIIDIYNKNNNYEELKTIKKLNDYNLAEMKHSKIENEKILSLSELNNGDLLLVQQKSIKIFEIENNGSLNEKQVIRIEDFMNIIQVIELTNGYLVSISQSYLNLYQDKNEIDDTDYLVFWKKNLMSEKYEIEKKLKRFRAIYLLEMNKYTFLVYCNNDQIFSYDSNTRISKEIGIVKTDFMKKFIKMAKVTEDDILLVYQERIMFLSITNKICKHLIAIYDDICYIPNSNNSLLASYSDKINKIYSLDIISWNINLKTVNSTNFYDNIHEDIINCIFRLSNGDIITCSYDKNIKIWKIITKPIISN